MRQVVAVQIAAPLNAPDYSVQALDRGVELRAQVRVGDALETLLELQTESEDALTHRIE
jgi:hypothetical protein